MSDPIEHQEIATKTLEIKQDDLSKLQTSINLIRDMIPQEIEKAFESRELLSKNEIQNMIEFTISGRGFATHADTAKLLEGLTGEIKRSQDQFMKSVVSSVEDLTDKIVKLTEQALQQQSKVKHTSDQVLLLQQSQRQFQQQLDSQNHVQDMITQGHKLLQDALLGDGQHIGLVAKVDQQGQTQERNKNTLTNEFQELKQDINKQHAATNIGIDRLEAIVRPLLEKEQKREQRRENLKQSIKFIARWGGGIGAALGAGGTGALAFLDALFS